MVKVKPLVLSPEYRALITELKAKVHAAQIKAAVKVNAELIGLYWDIGKLITERQQASGWGDKVIEQIAADLTQELGGLKGYSRRNLFRIKQWYGFYADQGGIVPQLVAQIPWGHNALIIEKIKDKTQALWYVKKTLENGWARSVLQLQIETDAYQRQTGKLKVDNFTDRLPAPHTDLFRETLKDPYIFDFLSVGDEAHEREIEQALVDHITRFLLELGKGFAYVGKQYHLEVGGESFYLDLLFYHLKLHCYVVFELKNGPFKPEYAGKLGFYLTALDRQVKAPEDNPSIGMILCKHKNNLIAEYALEGVLKPMAVSEFKLTQALPAALKTSLPTIEEIEAEFGDQPQDPAPSA